jgi:DNA-binding MarR family transcriptional regulator
MAVVREPHHRRQRWRVIIEDMDAEVVSLPQAPDAIELRHLRSFVAVADELNFGRAAARLYLSQPALSRQISSLERLVGCELLRRSTHRVELTLAGEALLGRVRELLQSLDEAVSVTRSLGGELLARVNRHWELAGLGSEVTDPGQDLQELRDAVEALHAQFEPPPGISVRPVNAAGVPALLNSPGTEDPATILYLHGGGGVSDGLCNKVTLQVKEYTDDYDGSQRGGWAWSGPGGGGGAGQCRAAGPGGGAGGGRGAGADR